jgi:hypothetical protein
LSVWILVLPLPLRLGFGTFGRFREMQTPERANTKSPARGWSAYGGQWQMKNQAPIFKAPIGPVALSWPSIVFI